MRALSFSFALLIVAGTPGCALYDAFFGAANVSADDICARYYDKLEEERCDLDGDTPEECTAVVECLRGNRHICAEPWQDFVHCLFEDEPQGCTPDGWSSICSAELENYLNCVPDLSAYACIGVHCDVNDPACVACIEDGCAEEGDDCREEPCLPGLVCAGDPPTCRAGCGPCPSGEECDVTTGRCVSPCASSEECGGAACASLQNACQQLDGFSFDDGGGGDVCHHLPSSPRCLRSCSYHAECEPGQRCWIFPVDTGELSAGGYCGPGTCTRANDECPTRGDGLECLDEANEPGSGLCARACDPLEDCSGDFCTGCTPEAPACVVSGVAEGGAPLFTCGGHGSQPALSVGSFCGDTGTFFRCAPGTTCARADEDTLACAEYCGAPGDCDVGSLCEPLPSPRSGFVGTCSDGAPAPFCSGDLDCDFTEVCRDVALACNAGAGLPATACEGLPDGAGCRQRCTVGDNGTCLGGERCWPDPDAAATEGGFCAPGSCTDALDCTGAGDVCYDASNGLGSGLCGVGCSPSPCLEGQCDCPALEPSCWTVAQPDVPDGVVSVCQPVGGLAPGEPCSAASGRGCESGLACVPDGTGSGESYCGSYCDPAVSEWCGAEACLAVFGVETGGVCAPPATASCETLDETCSYLGVEGTCVDLPAVCAAGDLTSKLMNCGALPSPACGIPCDTVQWTCPQGQRCYAAGENFSGVCGPGRCDGGGGCAAEEKCVTKHGSEPLCAERCSPASCLAQQGCTDCNSGNRAACVPVPDVNTITSTFVCAPSEDRGLGVLCDLEAIAPCAPGTLCALETDGTPRCLPICMTGSCPGSSSCEDANLPTDEQVLVCRSMSGLPGDSCTSDDDCVNQLCVSPDADCNSGTLRLETSPTCLDPGTSASPDTSCSAACFSDDQCGLDDRCYFPANGDTQGYCAPTRCGPNQPCASANVCADGICGAPCDFAACRDGSAQCPCDAASTCTPLEEGLEGPLVCRLGGNLTAGATCDDTTFCAADHVCVPSPNGEKKCRRLCAQEVDCAALGEATCDFTVSMTDDDGALTVIGLCRQ